MRPEQVTAEIIAKIESVLEIAAAFDQRTVGKGDLLAWSLAVGEWDEADLMEAVAAHYVDTNDRVMPADVAVRVKRMRRERIERAGLELGAAAPAVVDEVGRDLSPRAYIEERRRATEAAAAATLRAVGLRAVAAGRGRSAPGDLRPLRELLESKRGSVARKGASNAPAGADRGKPLGEHPEGVQEAYRAAQAMLAALPDHGKQAFDAAMRDLGPLCSRVDAVLRAAAIAGRPSGADREAS